MEIGAPLQPKSLRTGMPSVGGDLGIGGPAQTRPGPVHGRVGEGLGGVGEPDFEDDLGAPIPGVPAHPLREYYTHLLASDNKRMRIKAIRALLAMYHGGRCNQCQEVVRNYDDLYLWHFDHLHDLQDYQFSPTTGMRQFRISGNDCANRRQHNVFRHGMYDTQLLCRACHAAKNSRTFHDRQQYAQAVVHARDILGL